jgi:DNA-binding PadR family transcriptional regulator
VTLTRKVNKKGRSTSQFKTNKRMKIGAIFVPHTVEMLESPAWCALSRSARRVLDRIELEHMHHGNAENGQLPVTFENFEDYGLDRKSISPAIRELEALGFIEITQHGRSGNAEFRRPNKFRLTYIHKYQNGEQATDEWRRIETIEEAEVRARNAREKQNASAVFSTITSSVKSTTKRQFRGGKTGTTAMVDNPELLSRSSLGNALKKWSIPTPTEVTVTAADSSELEDSPDVMPVRVAKRVSARMTAKQYRAFSGRLN